MTVFVVEAYGLMRFFSTRFLARQYVEKTARKLGVGAHEFIVTEHEVDSE